MKIRIVNKKKFVRGIILVALIVICATCIPHNDWKDDYVTTEFYVTQGDTLWSIAEQYADDNIDINEYIFEVRQLNNMTTANVYAGDIITIYERGER